jgi:hypothetical protein
MGKEMEKSELENKINELYRVSNTHQILYDYATVAGVLSDQEILDYQQDAEIEKKLTVLLQRSPKYQPPVYSLNRIALAYENALICLKAKHELRHLITCYQRTYKNEKNHG